MPAVVSERRSERLEKGPPSTPVEAERYVEEEVRRVRRGSFSDSWRVGGRGEG